MEPLLCHRCRGYSTQKCIIDFLSELLINRQTVLLSICQFLIYELCSSCILDQLESLIGFFCMTCNKSDLRFRSLQINVPVSLCGQVSLASLIILSVFVSAGASVSGGSPLDFTVAFTFRIQCAENTRGLTKRSEVDTGGVISGHFFGSSITNWWWLKV